MKFRYSLLELLCFISALSVFVFLNLPRVGHGGTVYGTRREMGFPLTFYQEWETSFELDAACLLFDLVLMVGIPFILARSVEWGVRFWSNLSRERA